MSDTGMTEVRPVCCICDREIDTDYCYTVGDKPYDCICQRCVDKTLKAMPDNFVADVTKDDWFERYHKTPLFWI